MQSIRTLTASAALLLSTLSLGGVAIASPDGLAAHKPYMPTAATGDCKAGAIAFTSSDVLSTSTTSTTYVNLADGAVPFNQKKDGCIVVDFTAFSFAPSGELLQVQALLDGGPMFPGEIQFSGNDAVWAQSHAATWVANVKAGPHTIQIQFKSQAGGSVFIHRHTTQVAHR